MKRGLPACRDQRRFLLRPERDVSGRLVDESSHLLCVTCAGGSVLRFLLEEDFATHYLINPFAVIATGDTAPVRFTLSE